MRRGLAYEYPMGPIYQESARSRVHKNLNKLLGFNTNYFTKGNFDKQINNALFRLADEDFENILMESAAQKLRQFKVRSGDLLNSFGFAVYHNGTYQSSYVRMVDKDWESETDLPPADHSEYGSPQNALRRFAREYQCVNRQGFTVVFMVGYPYSVDLETGKTSTERKYAVLYYMGRHFVKQLQIAKPRTATRLTPVYQRIIGD